MAAPTDRPDPTPGRGPLAVALSGGVVLALGFVLFAPALPALGFMPPWAIPVGRVLAFAAGVGCLAGLLAHLRPMAGASPSAMRPQCHECGRNLGHVPAGADGRTMCPACGRSWTLPRDRAIWEHEPPATVEPSHAAPEPAPAIDASATPSHRTRRRAQRKAAANWTLVLAGYGLALWAALPLGFVLLPMFGWRFLLHATIVAMAAIPLAIVVVGVFAVARAGRGLAVQPCPSCGYDLIGLDRTKPGGVACPECGARV